MASHINYFELIEKQNKKIKQVDEFKRLLQKSNTLRKFIYYIIEKNYVCNYFFNELELNNEFILLEKDIEIIKLNSKEISEFEFVKKCFISKNIITFLNLYNNNLEYQNYINILIGKNKYLVDYAFHYYHNKYPKIEKHSQHQNYKKRKRSNLDGNHDTPQHTSNSEKYNSTSHDRKEQIKKQKKICRCSCCKRVGVRITSCGKSDSHPCKKCSEKIKLEEEEYEEEEQEEDETNWQNYLPNHDAIFRSENRRNSKDIANQKFKLIFDDDNYKN